MKLDKIPLACRDDFFVCLILVVERKTEMLDLALSLKLLDNVNYAELLNGIPLILVNGMEKIEIDVVHAHTLKLFIDKFLGVADLFLFPDRELGCKQIRASVVFFQRLADERLALSAVIGIGGIKISYSALIGTVDKLLRPFLVNFSVLFGETHTAVTQKGGFNTDIFKSSFFHKNTSSVILSYNYIFFKQRGNNSTYFS